MEGPFLDEGLCFGIEGLLLYGRSCWEWRVCLSIEGLSLDGGVCLSMEGQLLYKRLCWGYKD